MLPDKGEEYSSFEHSMFSHVVLDMARQVPYLHPGQDRLVRVLQLLQTSSKLTVRVVDEDVVRDHTTCWIYVFY